MKAYFRHPVMFSHFRGNLWNEKIYTGIEKQSATSQKFFKFFSIHVIIASRRCK